MGTWSSSSPTGNIDNHPRPDFFQKWQQLMTDMDWRQQIQIQRVLPIFKIIGFKRSDGALAGCIVYQYVQMRAGLCEFIQKSSSFIFVRQITYPTLNGRILMLPKFATNLFEFFFPSGHKVQGKSLLRKPSCDRDS